MVTLLPAAFVRSLVLCLSLAGLLAASGCDSPTVEPPDGSTDPGPDVGRPDEAPADTSGPDGGDATPTDAGLDALPPDLGPLSADCDPLDPELCALPWPSSLYLKEDTTTATGYRLTFGATTLPATRDDIHVDPTIFQHLDGYAVSSPIMVLIPNLDDSNLADENDIEASLSESNPFVLFEVGADKSLTRVPCFAELDRNEARAPRRTLIIRPAVILKEATRYVVALRGLNDVEGAPIVAGPAFASLRDGKPTGNAELDALLAPRQARFTEILGLLDKANVDPAELVLAWDFVTASSAALHGRLLSMRDDALTTVGASSAPLTVTSVTEFVPAEDGSGRAVDPDIALEVQGTFRVPSYLRQINDTPINVLNVDKQGVPQQNGTRDPVFWVRIPYSALNGPAHGLVIYGHGLLGSGDQVRGDFNGQIANQNNLIFFSADLYGMNDGNAPAVLATLDEVSNFVGVADPLQQGVVEWVLLARAMRAQLAGLKQLAEYSITVNPDELYYSGISQGGIFGGTVVAVSPDIARGHLGVPGSNYSLLLTRSADFNTYFAILRSNYPSTADQAVLLATLQLLWESTDPVSHYSHLTVDPHPGSGAAAKSVLMAPAKGDFQVAVVSNEILVRSGLGVSLLENYDDERVPFGIEPVTYPHTGSGVVLYDYGNAWPVSGNLVPEDPAGDPHGKPRRAAWHNQQLVTFLRTGEIVDVCGGNGCHPE